MLLVPANQYSPQDINLLPIDNICIFLIQDYMLLVPANQYSPQDINLLPIDNSRSFIEDCVDEGYKIRSVEPISQLNVTCLIHECFKINREHSGSVVECLTRDRRAAGLNLTGVTALCP